MVLVGKVDSLEIHVLAQILENRSYLLLNENGKGISLIDVSFDPKKVERCLCFSLQCQLDDLELLLSNQLCLLMGGTKEVLNTPRIVQL
jgi:hypothetical protein